MRHRTRRTQPQRGVIIVWLALFLLMMLSFISLGIDMAKLASTRTQLQNAADAAALAGASALDPATGIIVAATAVTRAQQTAALNKAYEDGPTTVLVDPADIVVTATTVKVTARREGDHSVIAHFAQVLGIPSLQMKADATAQVDTTSSALCGIVPLAGIPSVAGGFQVGCSNVYQLKLGAGTGSNGNYYPIRFPVCLNGPCAGMNPAGAATFECLLRNGYCCEIEPGDVEQTQTGNMSGPVRSAISWRFDQDVVRTEEICYTEYMAQGGNGMRVVTIPIVEGPPVGNQVTVQKFGVFFLRNRPGTGINSELFGEFIYAVIPGSGGGDGGGAVAFSLRLVE